MASKKDSITFQDLIVWQKSMELVVDVYRETQSFPPSDRFGLVAQMQRSALSIPSNIAEGQPRSKREFAQFARIALGSAAELETQLLICQKLGRVGDWSLLISKVTQIKKMLYVLSTKLTNQH